jgi:hypothetical protein
MLRRSVWLRSASNRWFGALRSHERGFGSYCGHPFPQVSVLFGRLVLRPPGYRGFAPVTRAAMRSANGVREQAG